MARTSNAPEKLEQVFLEHLLVQHWGEAPPSQSGHLGVFDVNPQWVALVRTEPTPPDAADPKPRVHGLLLTRKAYELIGHPFALADFAPVQWSARDDYPDLDLQAFRVPHPRTADILATLQEADTPLLYGLLQCLLDGGRALLIQDESIEPLLRQVWPMVPYSTRARLRVATWADSTALYYSVLAQPRAPEPWPAGVLLAEQLRDYPEGRYELAMQVAIENNRQHDYEALLQRRSSVYTLKLALAILVAVMLLSVVMKLRF